MFKNGNKMPKVKKGLYMVGLKINKKITCTIAISAIVILVLSSYTPALGSTLVNEPSLPIAVNTYGNAWNGEVAFTVEAPDNNNYLAVMNTNGTILKMLSSVGNNVFTGAIYNIANNTLLYQGDPHVDGADSAPTGITHIWNLTSNTMENFTNVIGEHDIQYNPINNTFLTLQQYIQPVGNNLYLIDKIVELNANGTVLWSWNPYNYIPISEASPLNTTVISNGETVIDFTHMNTLDWDYNNNIIYLNSRLTNTFYKINQTNGDLIWACGEFGNFTLLGDNGQPIANGTSLWYGEHDVKEVAPNVFTMFNNDYGNVTNANDSRSSLLEVTLNETSMTAYVNWSWVAPISYWNSFGGSNVILPNGDYLGCFGDPTHQKPQNALPDGTWDFADTGAVFVEVNPDGQVVRTWTLPVGYYVYRVTPLTNVTGSTSQSTTSTPSQSTTSPTTPTSSAQTSPSINSSILPIAIISIIVAVAVIATVAVFLRSKRNTTTNQKIDDTQKETQINKD